MIRHHCVILREVVHQVLKLADIYRIHSYNLYIYINIYIYIYKTGKLNDLYSSPNVVQVIKSRRMRWAGNVARMGREET